MIYLIFFNQKIGTRNSLLPFPLNSEFINNYRRLYGPVQLTSIMNGSDLTKSHRRSPVDSKHLKGNFVVFLLLEPSIFINYLIYDLFSHISS